MFKDQDTTAWVKYHSAHLSYLSLYYPESHDSVKELRDDLKSRKAMLRRDLYKIVHSPEIAANVRKKL